MGGNLDKIEKKTFFSLENGPYHHGFAPVSTCVLNLSARDTAPFLNSFYTWVCTCLHGSERCECEGHCLGETSSKISDCENHHTEGRVPQPNMAFSLTFKISSICSFSYWSKSKCISVSHWSRFSLFFCESFRCSCHSHHFKAMTSHFGSIPIMRQFVCSL